MQFCFQKANQARTIPIDIEEHVLNLLSFRNENVV